MAKEKKREVDQVDRATQKVRHVFKTQGKEAAQREFMRQVANMLRN